MQPFQVFFDNHLQQAKSISTATKKQINWLTISRLVIFILMLFLAYYALSNLLLWWAVIVVLTVFLGLMKLHTKANKKLNYHKTIQQICEQETQAFFSTFDGAEYSNAANPFAQDLDVLGEGSMYHKINRTTNFLSQSKLAEMLLKPAVTNQQVLLQQQAIKELSNNPEFILQYRTFSTLATQTQEQILAYDSWIKQPTRVIDKGYKIWLIWLVIAASIGGIFAAATIGYWGLLILAILSNWLWVGSLLKYSNKTQTIGGKQRSQFDQFVKINDLLNTQNFTSQTLQQLQQNYVQSTIAINALTKLLNTFDQRLNTMLGPILNSLLVFDVYCLWHIEKWKKQHGLQLQNWMQINAHFEALVSLATYAYKHPNYVYPVLSNQPLTFKATQLAHPLIDDEKNVSNSFEFNAQQKVFIITGSNMSGKSTFLRTVGVSILNGMIGLPVNATNMEFSVIKLLSSMRIVDSLQSDTSYFYAELKRLKTIMDEVDCNDLPALLFIDEMLRGTNSKEKLEGSIAIINKLVTKSCVSFIATHDLALGKLAEEFPNQVNNFSFESNIINNNLVFDYKIKSGVAQSTNATFLLKKMEIV